MSAPVVAIAYNNNNNNNNNNNKTLSINWSFYTQGGCKPQF